MTNFTEAAVQKAALTWLQELGYSHQPGNSLTRDLKKVVLEDHLRSFLQKSYPEVPATAINEAMARFTQHEGMDTDYRNRDFHRKCTQGISVSWKDAQGKENAKHIYPIDYKNAAKNSFICSFNARIYGRIILNYR